MINLLINNINIQAEEGMTILDAAKSAGISVPTLCHMKDLKPSGACRICVVEVEGMRGLVPSCAYPVSEGMKVQTNSPRVRIARKTIVELLVENHPQDCLICVRNKNCELQDLSEQYGIREHRYSGEKKNHAIDISSPSIERDPAKCILCGRCVRTCNEIQNIGAIDFVSRGFSSIVTTPFNRGINVSDCILCGQCILVCPTAALREKSSSKEVMNAINNKEKFVVAQIAPAVRTAFGEEFNRPAGSNVTGQIIAGLKRLGVDKVFDTNFAADLTIVEEATELIERIKNGGELPMFTSCCPGWIKYIEQFKPEMIKNLSSCKSPHEMEGSIIKTYYAEKMHLDPTSIFVVSIMPCTVKKYESQRTELAVENIQDVDAVLTTRELVRLFKAAGIDFNDLPECGFDNPLGESTGAAAIFGASGGVMEAALRTAVHYLKNDSVNVLDFNSLRGNDNIKTASLQVGENKINVAVVNGIGNISEIMDEIQNGGSQYHFIEVMACNGGCINGGGQPIPRTKGYFTERSKTLYSMDAAMKLRRSDENESIRKMYDEYLGKPGGHISHKLLHTDYQDRTATFRRKC